MTYNANVKKSNNGDVDIFKIASKMAPNNANDAVLKIMNFRMFYFLMTNSVHYIVDRSTQ